MEEHVTIYDFETKKLYEIPARELATVMIYAFVEGVGHAWVNAEKTKGIIRHPPFGTADRERLLRIQQAVADADPTPLDQWELNFRYDRDPWSEMEIWERIASVYTSLKSRFDPCERREVLSVLIHCTSTPLHLIESTVARKILTASKIRRIVAAYESFGRGSSGQGACYP